MYDSISGGEPAGSTVAFSHLGEYQLPRDRGAVSLDLGFRQIGHPNLRSFASAITQGNKAVQIQCTAGIKVKSAGSGRAIPFRDTNG